MNHKFYITTAIDYINSKPHIGTAFEKIGADVLARYKRMKGYETFFLMGNDEHSINVEKCAKKLNMDVISYCDKMEQEFKEVWKKLNISYDYFIRTTSKIHSKSVQKIFNKIYENGYIYKSYYEGLYCDSCEAYIKEEDLVEGRCKIHHTLPRTLKEENYFFKLSAFSDKLLSYYKENKNFILPKFKENEVINIIKGGLEDISISRAFTKWGIPVPFDSSQVIYVWFDALINYISAVGFSEDAVKFNKFWPADLHIIGKDIIKFHCIIWPAMLMAAEIPLPKSVFSHSFVFLKKDDMSVEKMSKTVGNIIEPLEIVDKFGADSLRYFLLREIDFYQDGSFSWEKFIERFNADLANDLGNLLNRTLPLVKRYFNEKIPKRKDLVVEDNRTFDLLKQLIVNVEEKIEKMEFKSALEKIWEFIGILNKYIDETKPWRLKEENQIDRLATVLNVILENIKAVAILLSPFIPETSEKILKAIGFNEKFTWNDLNNIDQLSDRIVNIPPPLFPRFQKEVKEKKESSEFQDKIKEIEIDDFARIDLRIGEVISVEEIPGSDKLYLLKIKGQKDEIRNVMAGIKTSYKKEDLIGKKVVIVWNLKPRKIRGVVSNGMILAVGSNENIALIEPDSKKIVKIGDKVK